MVPAILLQRIDATEKRLRVPRSPVARMGLAKGGAFY